jgi:hypothetical protein
MHNIFLSSKLNVIDLKNNQNINIILSPEFYWVRIFDLALNSQKDILKILPAMFEEFIYVDGLKFHTKKLADNKHLCFAYDEKKILENIKRLNIPKKNINGIYFAQIELHQIAKKNNQLCIKIDNICLSFIDDILVQIPCVLNAQIDNIIDIKTLELSKNKIYIESNSNFLEKKMTIILTILFLIFSTLNFVKSTIFYKSSNNIKKQIVKIKKDNKIPPTLIQTESITKKMQKDYEKQLKIREALEYIFLVKNDAKARVLSIKLKNDIFNIEIENKNSNKIFKYISKKYKIRKKSLKNRILTIGFKI